MDEARRKLLLELPGYIILIKKPEDPLLYGIVENSFSMSIEPGRTFLYWTSASLNIDGKQWAEKDLKNYKAAHPTWDFSMYNARGVLPVVLNWDLWLDAHELADTWSGIKNKHEARNLRFYVKDSPPEFIRLKAQALEPKVTVLDFSGKKDETKYIQSLERKLRLED